MSAIQSQTVTEKSQLNSHLTSPMIPSFKTSPTALGNAGYGGALFTLPREIRDEINRLVLKSHYILYTTKGKNELAVPRKGEHDFVILEA